MTGRLALGGLVASVAAVGAAYAGALLSGPTPGWAPVAMVAGIAGSAVSLMVLGAARKGGVGRLAVPFAFLFVVLLLGFGAALLMPPERGAPPELWLGLPPRAAVVLYGVGLLTLLVMPAAYALTFDEHALTEDDWRRVRRRAGGEDEGEAADPGSSADDGAPGRAGESP